MSLISFIQIGSLLLILLHNVESILCPIGYNNIANGCYKINRLNKTWLEAREFCLNDNLTFPTNDNLTNETTTHLIALEQVTEKNAIFYWMKAYTLYTSFWIDGNVSASLWNWSDQSILWFFETDERSIIGNGSNYKLIFNSTNATYQIADDINKNLLNFICEYQVPCNETNHCQNNANCYMNIGQELCVCASGFTGTYCETEILECLSSPCLHGGICIDGKNNYTCDCSNIFYTGSNCEIPLIDPEQNKRSTAFWSVLGIVTGLIVILTLSDLPWQDILNAIGCSCNCCLKQNSNNDINENNHRLSNSPTNDYNFNSNALSIIPQTSTSKGMNYNIMNTVWNPEHINNQTSTNIQYNGYRSPDQNKTPDNKLIQSFAASVIAKQKEEEYETKRIYAVNINNSTTKTTKDPVDTMVNWTQQLQEQLRNNKKTRETSANSTKQLIHSSNSNDN